MSNHQADMRVNKWRMNFNFGRTIFLWNSWASTIIVINVFHLVNKHFVLVNVIPKTYEMTNKHGVENAIFEKLTKCGAIIEVQKPIYFWSYWSFVIPKICLYPWSIQIYVDKETIMIWLCDQIYLHMECCTVTLDTQMTVWEFDIFLISIFVQRSHLAFCACKFLGLK